MDGQVKKGERIKFLSGTDEYEVLKLGTFAPFALESPELGAGEVGFFVCGIKDIRDESAKDIRVVIDLKGTAQPQTVLNFLYKHTQLEDTFHYNMVALVNGVPQTLSLKSMLEEFIIHRNIS